MGTLIHIAEVAGLLFVAYFVGWLIGYIAHRVAARAPKVASVPAGRLAAAKGEALPPEDALVKAPIVVPVSSAPPPAAPVPALATPLEPVRATAIPDGLAPAQAKPIEVALPPKVATPISGLDSLKTLSTSAPLMPAELAVATAAEPVELVADAPATEPAPAPVMSAPIPEPELPVAEPMVGAEPEIAFEPEPEPAAAPIAEPVTEAVPEPVQPAPPPMPASRPGVAWAGAIGGREAAPFEAEAAPVVEAAAAEPVPAAAVPEPVEVQAFNVEVLGRLADKLKEVEDRQQPVAAMAEVAPPTIDDAPTAEPVAAEPAPIIEPEPIAAPDPVAEPPAPPPKPAHVDEDSAMRAIEGGWSRRAARALPDAPEMTDVSAAVSAAQVAVEQVLARNGVVAAEPESRAQAAFGKPRGLPQPRLGGRDNLKQIKGLGPLDESMLNNMGIYHFDQISAWDQKEVLWLENHAFARGRIGREDWQAQARELLRGTEAAGA